MPTHRRTDGLLKGTTWIAALMIAAATTSGGVANAQSSAQDRAAAKALFDEARKQAKDGNFASACPKFEESQRLDPGIGTLFNLADCYQHVGKTASAWAMFNDIAIQMRDARNTDKEKAARARAAELEPKLLRLRVVVPTDVEVAGMEVRRDGSVVTKPMWGQGMPVDSGEHKIEVTAPGRKPWSKTIAVSGEGKTETVTVASLEPQEAAAPVAPPPASSQPATAPSATAPAAPSATAPAAPSAPPDKISGSTADGSGQRTVGLIAGGVGLVSLGVAGFFALNTKSKLSDADAYCNGTTCRDQKGVDLHDDAIKSADMASVFTGIGALGLVGGAVLYFTAPSSKPASSASARTLLLAGPGAIVVKGAF